MQQGYIAYPDVTQSYVRPSKGESSDRLQRLEQMVYSLVEASSRQVYSVTGEAGPSNRAITWQVAPRQGIRNPYETGRNPQDPSAGGETESSPSNPYGYPGYMVNYSPLLTVTRTRGGKTFTVGITPAWRDARSNTEGQRRSVRPNEEGETRAERQAELPPRRLPPTFHPERIRKNSQVGLGLAPISGKKKTDRPWKKAVRFQLDSTNSVIRRVPKGTVSSGGEDHPSLCDSPEQIPLTDKPTLREGKGPIPGRRSLTR